MNLTKRESKARITTTAAAMIAVISTVALKNKFINEEDDLINEISSQM
jgi:hypothetical protein